MVGNNLEQRRAKATFVMSREFQIILDKLSFFQFWRHWH